MKASQFAQLLTHGAKQRGDQWNARCPAHDDRKASLSFKDGEKGLLLRCHANCTPEAICAAVGKNPKEIFREVEAPQRQELSWSIRDVGGKVIAVHRRVNLKDGKKDVWWELPNGKRGLGGLKTEDLPLYGSQNLPRFDKSLPVYLCEGEPATDALLALGGQALGTITGAASLPSKASLEPLRGFKIRLMPDNDDSGRSHMQRAQALLNDLASEVVRLDTRSLPPKGDAVQWREALQRDGKTFEEMRALLDEGSPLPPEVTTPQASKKTLKVRTLGELFSLDLPPLTPILGEWLTERSLSMVYSKRGTGKTWFCLEMAYAVATGESFLRWQAREPRTVLYVDGEMPATTLIGRLSEIHKAHGAEYADRLRVMSFDDPENEEGIPDLCTPEGQAAIEEHLEGVSLLVLDNASCLFRSGDENEAQSWHAAQSWLMGLRRKGLAVILVHHAGKSGQQRGTSRREDTLDYVIKLQQPEDTKATDGARFTVTFEKNRHYYGPEVLPFEAQLTTDEKGRTAWTVQDVEAGKRAIITELLQSGMKVNAIAKEAGVSHGYVSQIKAKLVSQNPSNGRQRGEPVSGYSPYKGGGVTDHRSLPLSEVTTNRPTNRPDSKHEISTENYSTNENTGTDRPTNRFTNQTVTNGEKNGYYPPNPVTALLTDSVPVSRGVGSHPGAYFNGVVTPETKVQG